MGILCYFTGFARYRLTAVYIIKEFFMKKTNKVLGFAVITAITLVALFVLSTTACSGSGGGGKSLNSATELKEYLDKQPANSPDKPIKVAMKVNEMMIKDIAKVISEAGKYVSLDLSGSPLTEIPKEAFEGCKTLAGIIIPNSVTSIGSRAFWECPSLTSVTIPNNVTSIDSGAFLGTNRNIDGVNFIVTKLTSVTFSSANITFKRGAFPDGEELLTAYTAGGAGTYTRPNDNSDEWTKQ
jgi:hypothetical protein